MKDAVRILREEHRLIGAVLHALQALAAEAERGAKPDFALLRAIVWYIDAFPERQHHPKENDNLFARLEARSAAARGLLAVLRDQHEECARRVRELERALLAFEQAWPQGAAQFRRVVEDYAAFNWQHLKTEEEEVLPLAERLLDAADWAAIGEAFAANRDPLTGVEARAGYQRLFERILAAAPSPIGLGEPWRRPH